MNGLPKYVASTTLQEPLVWNATLLKGDAAKAVAELKRQPGWEEATFMDRSTRSST
jgi:hypothetical protein